MLHRTIDVQVVPFSVFAEMFSTVYVQGEHVSIVGPTGSGKTRVGLEICKLIAARPAKDKRPSRVTVLCYKPRDDTMREVLSADEWPVIRKWPPRFGQEHCIVWVKSGTASTAMHRQRAVFVPLIDRVYREGGQTIYIPEAAHFERGNPHGLGMGGLMTELWSSARSNKLSVISDTQRPRHVTISMWSEPTWLIIFPPDDEEDLRRVAQLSGSKMAVYHTVHQLGDREFLCVVRQRGNGGHRGLYVSKVGT